VKNGVEHVKGPIVLGARWIVRCACGFAHDSAASTGAQAMEEFTQRHRHEGAAFTFETAEYNDHPLLTG
jgi:hypothetical protein